MLHELVRFCVCSATVACIGCAVEPAPPYPPSSGGYGASVGGASVGGASAGGGVSAGGAGGGVQQSSFTLSTHTMSFFIVCDFTPQILTITNSSNVTLDWTSTNDFLVARLSPPGSTLVPGESIAVTVIPLHLNRGFGQNLFGSTVSINATGAQPQILQLSETITGHFLGLPPPADIDFGNVPLGGTAKAFVRQVEDLPDEELVSANEAFSLGAPGLDLGQPSFQGAEGFGWTVTFAPTTAGPQQSTLSLVGGLPPTCPPNTFVARGVGVVPDAGTATGSTAQ